jgi:UDP-N-acetylglucosamine--N-acetylmuramyl-(pentapeptide) pyrophosphoryl-undecaprenol N-acetylglucosamine transferase
VAEDHQTKNAMALVNKNAAALLRDSEAETKLFDMVSSLLSDKDKQKSFSENIASLAVVNSADLIAKEIVEMIK